MTQFCRGMPLSPKAVALSTLYTRIMSACVQAF
jgi:hypothetical protein